MKHDFLKQTSRLLLGIFICLTTVTRSERNGDEELSERNFTNNITRIRSTDTRSELEDTKSQDGGREIHSTSHSTRFTVTGRVIRARGDNHQNVIQSTTQTPNNSTKCLSLPGSALSVTHSVTLLRISPQFSTSHSSAGPITFSVDSTITILTIEINSSATCNVGIWDPTGTMINRRWKREAKLTKQNDHQEHTHFTPHIQLDNIFNNSLNYGINNFYTSQTRTGLTHFKRAGLGSNNNININKQRRRTKRTVRLTTLEDNDGAAVWEIDPPNIGMWSLSIDDHEPVQITVTAISSLDFTFEFLDIHTESSMTSQPIAYETTLVRLTVTTQPCVANITVLNLYSDAGETISAVESKDVDLHLDQMTSTGKGSILFWLQMPDVPFYMSATGYDVTGKRFQRLSSKRVIPRMFALSFVNFRSDPLVPGTDYKFGVRLRNKGGDDVFKIEGTWDNSEYFKVVIVPSRLKVEQNQIAHAAMVVSVKPPIYFIVKGALTVTACRLSDNVTDTLTETLTGEPASYLQDYESPTCTTTTTHGGCRPNIPCQVQKWTCSVLVSDSLTGVRSAVFLDPPHEAFNNVQFLYSMTNRTARAEYGYTCCNIEATLLVYDYAKNPAYCKLTAPILDPQTTTHLQYSVGASSAGNNLTSDSSFMSPITTSVTPNNRKTTSQNSFEDISSRWSLNSSTFVTANNFTIHKIFSTLTGNIDRTPDFHQNGGQSESSTFYAATSGQTLGGRSSSLISLTFLTSLNHVVTQTMSSQGSTNSSALVAEGNRANQQSVNAGGYSTLIIAAVVCGSLAGVAGLAIAVICVVFRCMVKHQRGRPWRRRSNDSDVTMGSSSETRSVGSYSADSLRMSRTGRNIGKSWPGVDSCSLASKESGIDVSSGTGDQDSTGRKSAPSSDECYTQCGGPKRFQEVGNIEGTSSKNDDIQYDEEVRNRTTPSLRREEAVDFMKVRQMAARKREEVEDVIFRCVVVKKAKATEDGAQGSNSDTGALEVGQISYSPLLRSGGKTYSSMLQVQKQIEEMDHQRRNLSSSETSERCNDFQRPDFGAHPRAVIRSLDEGRAIPGRLYQYGVGSSSNDLPPGSPQFKNLHVHAPSQNGEMRNVLGPNPRAEMCNILGSNQRVEISNDQGEIQSKNNLHIRHHFPRNDISASESERTYIQMETSNQTGVNSDEDTPHSGRSHRGSAMQHKSPSGGTNEPNPSPKTTSFSIEDSTKTTKVSPCVGGNNCECCESSIHSQVATSSNDINTTSGGTNPRTNYKNYNQKPSKTLKSRKHFKISQTAPEHGSSNEVRTPGELVCQRDEARGVENVKRPDHSTFPQGNLRELEATNGSQSPPSRLRRSNGMRVTSSGSRQPFVRVHRQNYGPKIPVYSHPLANSANEVHFDAVTINEIDEKGKDSRERTTPSNPTTQTPSNSRSESPDPRYLQPGSGSRVTSDANQIALRDDIEHIRQKLLKFQQRIDHEIQEESRRSGGNSPCPFENSSQSNSI